VSKARVLVGKFSGLKLPVFGKTQIIKCRLEIELRSSPNRPEWFFVFWKFNNQPVQHYAYRLSEAQNLVAEMFVEQIEPWHDIGSVQP
jgi:hypothetical protein